MNKKLFSVLAEEKSYLILLLFYTFFLLFYCSKMSPLYVTNEWADPNVYFNIAKGMVNGRTLYTEIFDHKGPLIFFIYALGYLISHDSFFGMFIIELMVWVVLGYSVYFTSRLYLNKGVSLIISTVFFLFLVKLMKAGGSAEEFILCFEAVSLYFFMKYFKSRNIAHKPGYMLIHGMMVTATLLIKINLIVFWFFPLLFIFLNILFHKKFKNFILNVLTYIAGTLIVSAPVLGYLWCNGALEEAYKVYIELNRSYAKIGSFSDTFILLFVRILYLFIDPVSLLVISTMGIFYFPFKFMKNPLGKWSLVLSGIILYIIIFMGKFQYYYPISYIIFCVLGLIGLALYLIKYTSSHLTIKPLCLLSFICLFAGMSLTPSANTRVEEYFLRKSGERSRVLQTDLLRHEIMKEKNPTLLNLGFGMGNNLFTTCNIVPNIKYFIRPNLSYTFYPQLRNEQFNYIKNKKTTFVLIQEYIASDDYYKKENPVDRPRYLKNLPVLKENYNLILSDTVINKIDENSVEIYHLYKRK